MLVPSPTFHNVFKTQSYNSCQGKKDLITLDMTPLYKYGTYKCPYKDDSVPFFNIPQNYALTGFSWFLKKDDLKNKSYDNAKS